MNLQETKKCYGRKYQKILNALGSKNCYNYTVISKPFIEVRTRYKDGFIYINHCLNNKFLLVYSSGLYGEKTRLIFKTQNELVKYITEKV